MNVPCTSVVCTYYLCDYSQITIHFRLLIEYMGTFFKTHYLFECTTYLISRVSKYVVSRLNNVPKFSTLKIFEIMFLTLRKLKLFSEATKF